MNITIKIRTSQFNWTGYSGVDVHDVRKLFDSYCDIFNINTATDPESLTAYPHISKLYISLNTGLSSSAAVERLFSLRVTSLRAIT